VGASVTSTSHRPMYQSRFGKLKSSRRKKLRANRSPPLAEPQPPEFVSRHWRSVESGNGIRVALDPSPSRRSNLGYRLAACAGHAFEFAYAPGMIEPTHSAPRRTPDVRTIHFRTPAGDMVEIFELLREPELAPRFNIAPTSRVAVVRQVGIFREPLQCVGGSYPPVRRILIQSPLFPPPIRSAG
jgi:hypothetical protein